MMPREVRTDLALSLKTKGFAQGQQELARVTRDTQKAIEQQVKGFETTGKAMGAVDKEIKRLEGVLQGFAKQQAAINQLMEEMGDKTSKEYKALASELKNVDREAQRVTRTISVLDRAFMRQRAQREGFVQGLGQGLAPGVAGFIQRGPGMRRQMVGQAVGAGIRGVAGAAPGMAAGIFSGPQAAANALRGIPFVGGALAAMVERPMQQAQQAMQYQQARMEAMPYLGGVGLQRQMHAAGERARRSLSDREITRRAIDARHDAMLGPMQEGYMAQVSEAVDKQREAYVSKRHAETGGAAAGMVSFKTTGLGRGVPGGTARFEEEWLDRVGGEEGLATRKEVVARQLMGHDAEVKQRRELRAERNRRGRRAEQQVRRQALGLGAGVQFGMALPEEVQFRAGIQQVGGGFGVTEQERQMGVTGMAAQRAFGVQAGVSGAFLQAGRRGGLIGAEGGASEMLTDSLADAMKLGLEGSEINDYLQQMASGINSWKTTGIPFNKQSMADIAGTLGTMGMGGVRGMAIAGGVSRAAEQLSRTGPQSVGQLMMLQTMGGMKPGQTGMEAMEEALIKLEEKTFEGEDFKKLIGNLLRAGGGGAEGRRVAYGVLSQMGINISRGEIKAMDEGQDLESWMKRREERIAGGKLAERTAASPEMLARVAAEAVPDALKKQASLTNQQIQTGGKMIGAMQKLEQVAQTITNKMGDIGPTVEKLAGNLEALTEVMIDVVEGKGPGFFETIVAGVTGK